MINTKCILWIVASKYQLLKRKLPLRRTPSSKQPVERYFRSSSPPHMSQSANAPEQSTHKVRKCCQRVLKNAVPRSFK